MTHIHAHTLLGMRTQCITAGCVIVAVVMSASDRATLKTAATPLNHTQPAHTTVCCARTMPVYDVSCLDAFYISSVVNKNYLQNYCLSQLVSEQVSGTVHKSSSRQWRVGL